MTSMFARAIVLALAAAAVPSMAGRLAGSGRLVEWIPFTQEELTVSAAVGRSVNTVVLYNPDRLGHLPAQVLQFVIRRQDFVAFLAADLLRGHGQFAKPWGSLDFPDGSSNRSLPFSPIREEQVFSHEVLRRTQERGLDCLAYQSLDARERVALRDLIRSEGPIQVYPSDRKLSARELTFFDSDSCVSIFGSLRQ